jgi:uncharacterized membrane protein YbhN (UPF0104 family)
MTLSLRPLLERLRALTAALPWRPRSRPSRPGTTQASGSLPAREDPALVPIAASPQAPAALGSGAASGSGRSAAALLATLRARLGRLPSLPGGLRPWFTLASLGFVMAALVGNARPLLQLGLDPQGWLWLVLGVGFSLLSVVANGLAWTVLLRWLGLRPRWEASVTHFMTTNLRKFLPGGIWHLAARVQALRRGTGGVELPQSAARSLLVVVLEPLLAAIAALALVGLGGWQGGLGLAALLPLGLLNPRWLEPLLARLERRKARDLAGELGGELADPETAALAAAATEPPLPGYPWPPLLAQLAFVLLRFAGFACCVWAFDLQLSLPWTTWLSGFALAWTVGLVVPGAPGGLGVFEAVLLLRLGGGLAAAPLLAVALSYRMVATLGDVLASLLADLDGRLARGGPGLPSQ